MQNLKSKVALITGGASGLGKAIAQRLAADGATVVITDLQTGLGQATAREGGFTFLQQDVTNEVQWLEIIREIEHRYGRLDILVNNAGITGPLDAINPETTRFADWKKVFSVNVDSVFLGCRAAIPALRRAGGGSIINISSIAGLSATPYGTAYGASKATVRQLTKSVAQHGAPDRIRCNSVHPGDVRTPLRDKVTEELARQQGISVEASYAEVKARIPIGKLARPEDIAAAVAFLASDESRHMTGTKLIVDGGVIPCNTFQPKGKKP
jgi:3(or 17)beta-hydroxysteroid dehydrogenase